MGELATKWEQTNPTTWRFTLRQGVKFHDGTPWNAETAADAMNEMLNKENNYRVRTFLGPEIEAKPVSEYVLDLVTSAPDPILPTRVYFMPFHSPTARKARPDEVPTKPIGTGPYKFVEWVKGQHIKVTANPDWWGNGAADAGGAATIKDVTFVSRPAREVRAAMVQSGEADLGRWVSQAECKASPQCKGAPTVETIFIRLDTMNPTLADRRVREAIALAVDKEAITNNILGGGDLATMLIRPTVLGSNPALKPYPYDPARAKALIAEAKAAGVPVDAPLTVLARRGAYFGMEEAVEAVADMLQQAGLTNLTIQILETSKHTEIYSLAPKPIDPDRGIIAVHSHGNELLDFGQTVRFYYTCDGRQSTYCNPGRRRDARTRPVAGRGRAGEGVPGDRQADVRRGDHDPDHAPVVLLRDEQASGVDATPGRLHPAQGDEAQGVGVRSVRWRSPDRAKAWPRSLGQAFVLPRRLGLSATLQPGSTHRANVHASL